MVSSDPLALRSANITTCSSVIQVPVLNLISNIKERAGWCHIRVGGNTQENAQLVASLPNGTILAKDNAAVTGTTQTPPIEYTPDLLYMLSNISSLVGAKWSLGIPFFNTTPFSLAIVERSQQILGSNLFGYQAGNEPDLYSAHGHRNAVSARPLGPYA